MLNYALYAEYPYPLYILRRPKNISLNYKAKVERV